MLDIIFITVVGILSGAEGWSEIQEFAQTKQEWIRQYRPLNSGIPSEDTIARVIKMIDPKALNASFIAWVNQLRASKGYEQIAIDGKTLKHSRDGEKHKQFKQELESYFHKIKRDDEQQILYSEQHDVGHGRIETRRCEVLTVSDWLEHAQSWKNIQQVIRIERTRIDKKTGLSCTEEQYYISSLNATAEQFSHYIRQHWGIENQVHWLLDVIYKEDDCRIRKDYGAENIATIRRLCLNIAKLHPSKASMKAKLKKSAWDDNFRHELIFGVNLI